MKTKSFTKGLVGCALLAASLVTGCKEYDDTGIRKDIADLQGRVESLEAWCETAKGQISALQSLVAAVESRDYITGVEPVTEAGKETGYAISLGSGKTFTVKHGTQGDPGVTPQIGVAKDEANPSDENYYWTVKTGDDEPEFIVDPATGGKMPVTGEKGDTPELSVAEDNGRLYWKVGEDWLLSDGAKVPATGEQGDAIFAENGVDYTTDPNSVTFTLADGTTFKVPYASTLLTIVADEENVNTFSVTSTLFEESGNVVDIRVESENADGMTIATRVATTRWTVESEINGDVLTITADPADAVELGEKALLKVTVSDATGQVLASGRTVFTNARKDNAILASSPKILANALNNDPEITEIKLDDDLALDQTLVIEFGDAAQRSVRTAQTLEKTIDLNGKTLTGPKNGSTILFINQGTVTFRNGTIDIANAWNQHADINVGVDKSQDNPKSDEVVSKATAKFHNVKLNACVLVRYGSSVEITDSEVENPLYCVTTNANASKADTERVTVKITNTELTGETPVMLNVPSSVEIDNCTITGGWQGVMMRGGTATIKNSRISLQEELAANEGSWLKNRKIKEKWGSGNEIPVAGITMGNNTGTAYQYPTSVTLENTQVSGYEDYWAVFADATETCIVNFKYDNQCTFSPILNTESSFKQGLSQGKYITVNNDKVVTE